MAITLQGSAKRWALGCVNMPPVARGSQEARFTQPRAHLLADPCRYDIFLDADHNAAVTAGFDST